MNKDMGKNLRYGAILLTICAICAVVLGIVFLFMWRKRWALLQKRAAEHAAAAAAEEAAA